MVLLAENVFLRPSGRQRFVSNIVFTSSILPVSQSVAAAFGQIKNAHDRNILSVKDE